ncbi:MAG TPA: ABC transporter permease [Acidocella sp.]|nr:ABC transporter permease [Acidocella sp.]
MNMIVPDREKAEIPHQAELRQVVISASRDVLSRMRMAAADLRETLRLWPLVWTLSVMDIRLRYRGSLLGPFWLTLSTGVMIAAIGFVYSRLFHQNISEYLPFLTISLVLWNFVSTTTAEGCLSFTQAEGTIRAMRMPLSLHAARVVVRNLLVVAHNIVVIIIVFALFRTTPSLAAFSIIPACLLWAIDALALTLILGAVGARFRDIPPIVGSIMQIAFYVTPIIWSPTMLAHRGLSVVLVEWNPFYALIEVVRGPLLGQALEPVVWEIALGFSAVLALLAVAIFTRARPRIAYWL